MTSWPHKITHYIASNGPGSYVVDFPAYRPDLIQSLAKATGCAFLDFRLRHLVPLGLDAHRLSLSALETAIDAEMNGTGLVIHNGEALLAAKPAAERIAWLRAFLDTPRQRLAIVPLALFGRELQDHPRLVRLQPGEVPEESTLLQLASMRLTS